MITDSISSTRLLLTVLVVGALSAGAFCIGCEGRSVEEAANAPSADHAYGAAEPPRADQEVQAAAPGEAKQAAPPNATASTADNLWPWGTPAGWREDTTPRPMRLTTYMVDDPSGAVEIAVTRFRGRVGGELANVNRWRRQMGLESVDEATLDSTITRFAADGFEGYEARIASDIGVMLTSGVYDTSIDQTWFVRTQLPDAEAADRVAPGLFAMARSIASAEAED